MIFGKMKITLVGPGIMPIPPVGWGAVEILVWDTKNAFEELGHEVQIINTTNLKQILHEINSFRPDFVHIQYDDFINLCPYIQYPNAITSHFGYLEQPNKWDYYGPRVAAPFNSMQPNVFCLSAGILNVYKESMNFPENKLFLTPNGVDTSKFIFSENPKYPNRSIFLAKIDYRKRQHLFQTINSLWYAGNNADPRFDVSKNYLGEWSKDVLYNHLTDYGNLVLLSDGEAHPLVCMEALVSGLGVVISEWASANLDVNKKFITVISESKIHDIEFVENSIIENREYSVKNREEIREYGMKFDWKKVISEHHIPNMKKVIQNYR